MYGVSARAAAGTASAVATAVERSALLLGTGEFWTGACWAACCPAQHQRMSGMLAQTRYLVMVPDDDGEHARFAPLAFCSSSSWTSVQVLEPKRKPTCVIAHLLGSLPARDQHRHTDPLVQHVGGPWCARCALRLWAFPHSWRLWRWRLHSAAERLRRAAWRGEAATRQPWCAPWEAQPEQRLGHAPLIA